jgi:hypothetical protein
MNVKLIRHKTSAITAKAAKLYVQWKAKMRVMETPMVK